MKYPDYMDYYFAASIGENELSNHDVIDVFGYCYDMVFPTGVMKLRSNDPNDDFEKSGKYLEICGLDVNGNEVIENLKIIDGVEPENQYSRINKIEVKAGINEGTIILGGYIIQPSEKITKYCQFTVPREKTGYITQYNTLEETDIYINEGEGFKKINCVNGYFQYKAPYKLNEFTDIVLIGENNLDASLQIILIGG